MDFYSQVQLPANVIPRKIVQPRSKHVPLLAEAYIIVSEKPETPVELSLPVCSTSEQYAKYRKLVKIWDSSGEKEFYRLTGCTPPCRQRRYKVSHFFTSNFDCVKFYGNSSDNATIEVTRNFGKSGLLGLALFYYFIFLFRIITLVL